MFGLGFLACCAAGVFLWGANPVHGVLSLVVVGLALAGGLLRGGLEFPALLVVLVYVGAVTVLFVFVVMMVNLRGSPASYVTPEGVALVAALGGTLWVVHPADPAGPAPAGLPAGRAANLTALGGLLYGSERAWGVALVGGVLFVAMVAAICLSLAADENYRSQEFYTQIRRPNAVFVLRS